MLRTVIDSVVLAKIVSPLRTYGDHSLLRCGDSGRRVRDAHRRSVHCEHYSSTILRLRKSQGWGTVWRMPYLTHLGALALSSMILVQK